jgi:rhodanese-related sulfurtransferase
MGLSPFAFGSWAALKQVLHFQFPKVRSISTVELAEWLSSDRPQPLLLDVRTPEEFAVSHLQTAQRIDPTETEFGDLQAIGKNMSIVAYCSVGYRSAVICDRLQAQGFTNVLNLEGSIFAWANDDRPVYRYDKIVQQVHPSSPLWGALLRKDFHAYQPDSEASFKAE